MRKITDRLRDIESQTLADALKTATEAADRIEVLEGVLADIMQYDLRGILPPDTLQRMEDMKVVI